MNFDVHPTHPGIDRPIFIGGATKPELLARLEKAGVQLNQYALTLFAHDKFTTATEVVHAEAVQLSVAQFGFAEGAVIGQICDRAASFRLSLCPLEMGAHFRLQYLDQPEGHIGFPPSRHRAPSGSITVVSPELSSDDETPKGLYLRRIDRVLWLRGYVSGPDHVWSPEDQLVFIRPRIAAAEQPS